ncbi:YqzE family protein [Thalassobacillus sp. CUG 92003]|uniref:YqzE family protein n=1 Tax=Thalassobacillus sp. CUG 92003 TaxID=2736641 RepID=UPI0015E65913|nr:YqzE family protein [Thalassobacillus sp. CUG 92003]
MSGNDYVKFLTEEMVKYMHMSKEQKQARKAEKPSRKKTYHWFGVLPLALRMLWKK